MNYSKTDILPTLNTNEYRAHMSRKDSVLKAVERANARIAKRGYTEILSVNILREFKVEGKEKGQWIPKFDFELVGPTFVYGGWRFVGVIDHLTTPTGGYANIVRSFDHGAMTRSGKDWNSHGPDCFHCSLKRNRKQTVVVEKGGEFVQVGTKCLEAYTECAAGVMILNEIEKFRAWGNGGNLDGSEWAYSVRDILACAVRVTEGATLYHKVGGEHDCTKHSTFECLNQIRLTGSKEPLWSWPSDEDFKLADTILQWVISTFDPSNSYQCNVLSLLEASEVRPNHVGIMASVIGGWVRYNMQQATKVEKANEWVGKKGETFMTEATLTRKNGFGTRYGYMTIYTFEDAKGNIIVWKTTATILVGEYEIRVGTSVMLKGTVKDHDMYKSTKQTVLTRCKVNVMGTAA